jgi:hypothetical protein
MKLKSTPQFFLVLCTESVMSKALLNFWLALSLISLRIRHCNVKDEENGRYLDKFADRRHNYLKCNHGPRKFVGVKTEVKIS